MLEVCCFVAVFFLVAEHFKIFQTATQILFLKICFVVLHLLLKRILCITVLVLCEAAPEKSVRFPLKEI